LVGPTVGCYGRQCNGRRAAGLLKNIYVYLYVSWGRRSGGGASHRCYGDRDWALRWGYGATAGATAGLQRQEYVPYGRGGLPTAHGGEPTRPEALRGWPESSSAGRGGPVRQRAAQQLQCSDAVQHRQGCGTTPEQSTGGAEHRRCRASEVMSSNAAPAVWWGAALARRCDTGSEAHAHADHGHGRARLARAQQCRAGRSSAAASSTADEVQ
jgi:hypothetical protein